MFFEHKKDTLEFNFAKEKPTANFKCNLISGGCQYYLKGRIFKIFALFATLLFWCPQSVRAEKVAFDYFPTECSVYSLGGVYQQGPINVVKDCIKEHPKIAFYAMNFLNRENIKRIFYDKSRIEYEIIIILNGIDRVYIEKELIRDPIGYAVHHDKLKENAARLSELAEYFEIHSLSSNCLNLNSTDGCYEKIREQLDLPTFANIRTRVKFRLMK